MGSHQDTLPLGSSATSPRVDGAWGFTQVSPLQTKLKCLSSGHLSTVQRALRLLPGYFSVGSRAPPPGFSYPPSGMGLDTSPGLGTSTLGKVLRRLHPSLVAMGGRVTLTAGRAPLFSLPGARACQQPGSSGRQVWQDTWLDGPPFSWGQATGTDSWAKKSTSRPKGFLRQGADSLPLPTLGRGLPASLLPSSPRTGTWVQTLQGLTTLRPPTLRIEAIHLDPKSKLVETWVACQPWLRTFLGSLFCPQQTDRPQGAKQAGTVPTVSLQVPASRPRPVLAAVFHRRLLATRPVLHCLAPAGNMPAAINTYMYRRAPASNPPATVLSPGAPNALLASALK